MSRLPGIGARIAERLVSIGFARGKRPDVGRFCAERGYRPQYVYAWLRGRTPSFENLERLASDLGVSRSWLAVGEESEVALAVQQAAHESRPATVSARSIVARDRRETPAPAPGGLRDRSAPRLQVLDFARLRDVTAKLVQLEAQLAAIFEAFPDLYIWVDGSGRILDWKGGKSVPDVLFGRSIGQPIDEVFADDAGRRLHHAVSVSIQRAEPTSVDYSALVDGAARTFEGRLMPLDSPGSPRPHVLIVMRDITERLRAEQAVRESEARYRALAEGSIEGICINQDGRIAFANQAFCDMLGYRDPGMLVGQPVNVVAAPEDRDRLERYRQARLNDAPAPARYEFQALRRDGTRVWLESVASLINWDGRPAILTTAYDFSERKRARETMAALAEAGRELAGTLDLDELLERMLERIFRMLRVRRASVYTLDKEASVLRCLGSAGRPVVADIRGRELPLTPTSITARAVIDGRAVTSADVLVDPALQLPEWAETLNRDQGLHAALSVPLIGHQGTIGALVVHDVPGRVFDDDEIGLLVAFADHAVIALENARLYRQSQQRLRHTEALLEVGHAVGSTLDLVEVARRAVRETVLLLSADLGAAWRLDPAGRLYRPVAGYRIPKDTLLDEARQPVSAAAPLIAEVIARRAPLLVGDSHDDRRFDSPLGRAIPHKSVMLLPLQSRGAVVGLISVGWTRAPHRFTAEDLQLVEGISRELTVAFENAELVAAAQRHLRRLTALETASRGFSTQRRFEGLVTAAVEEARRVADTEAAALLLLDRGRLLVRGVAGAAVDVAGHKPIDDEGVWRVISEAQPANVEAVPTTDAAWQTVVHLLGVRSLLAVPVLHNRVAIGALAVGDRNARHFESGDVEVMTTLAQHVAMALDNARLHEASERRLGEASVLREIGLCLTGLAPLPALLDTVHAQLGRLVDVSNMIVCLARKSGTVRVALRYRDGVRDPQSLDDVTTKGLVGVVMAQREAMRTDAYVDECARAGVEPFPESLAYPYWLGMPLIAGNETVGALVLRSRERPFSDHDERMLGEVATVVAVAVRDAQLFDELAASRDVLSAVAVTHDALVATDLRGRIVYFSAAAEAITRHPEAEARELCASDFYRGGREEAVALMERMRRDGEVRAHPTWILRRGGGYVPVTVSMLPLRDPAGVVIGTLGVVGRRAEPQG